MICHLLALWISWSNASSTRTLSTSDFRPIFHVVKDDTACWEWLKPPEAPQSRAGWCWWVNMGRNHFSLCKTQPDRNLRWHDNPNYSCWIQSLAAFSRHLSCIYAEHKLLLPISRLAFSNENWNNFAPWNVVRRDRWWTERDSIDLDLPGTCRNHRNHTCFLVGPSHEISSKLRRLREEIWKLYIGSENQNWMKNEKVFLINFHVSLFTFSRSAWIHKSSQFIIALSTDTPSERASNRTNFGTAQSCWIAANIQQQ